MSQQKTKDNVETLNPQGYINNREITNLPGTYLVQGSRDCVIENQEKVSSRKGYTLVGSAKSKNKGHYSSCDWETSFAVTRSLRLNTDGDLQVYYSSDWRTIKTYADNTRANFWPWYSSTEAQDLLLFVVQTANIEMWSGGCAKVGTFTATTLTIQGYLQDTSIAFVEGGAGVDDTITDSNSNFLNRGYEAGDVITISGSASNDGSYTIKTVTAGTITLVSTDDLTAEAAGATVTITRPGATWSEQGFLTAGTRKVVISGSEYAYTGGETTATLTGLSGLSGIASGTVVVQAVRQSSPATLAGLTLDLIATIYNHVFFGDLTSRVVYMSSSSDYTSFTASTPRVPGEGAGANGITLDSTPTAFVPGAVEDEFFISARKDDWYKLTFDASADLAGEELTIKKLPTSTGQAAQSQASIVRIKNGVSFLSFEPSIDTLTRLLSINTPTSLPISDDIKNDILSYDRTDHHGIFYQNQSFHLFPAEGILQIYDHEQGHWQPPHHLPLGRLALIDVDEDGTQVLCGHSAVSNETYKLYDGYTDNGAALHVEAHFGYDNYGSRFTSKTASEFSTEIYMSENTKVTNKIVLDYKGATDIREFELNGATTANKFAPVAGAGLGSEKMGSNPLGSLATAIDDLSKYRFVDTTPPVDFFERQRVFTSNGEDIRFSIIAYADDVEVSENIPNYLKR